MYFKTPINIPVHETLAIVMQTIKDKQTDVGIVKRLFLKAHNKSTVCIEMDRLGQSDPCIDKLGQSDLGMDKLD